MGIDGLSGLHEISQGWTDKPIEEKVEEVVKVVSLDNHRSKSRFEMAKINQQLAMEFYQVLSEPDSYPGEQAGKLVEALHQKAKSLNNEKGLEVQRVLAGARAQGGLMHFLGNAGFWVMFPENEKDISIFDRQGVDFAAVSKSGSIFFISVKARFQRKDFATGKYVENTKVIVGAFDTKIGTTASMLTAVAGKLMTEGKDYEENKALIRKSKLEYIFGWVILPSGRKFMDFYGKLTEEVGKSAVVNLEALPKKTWT